MKVKTLLVFTLLIFLAANNGTASYLTLDDPNPTIVGPTSGSFEAIQSRVDILSKSKKLPANLDKAKTLKDKATEMMTTLGMQIPAGAKS